MTSDHKNTKTAQTQTSAFLAEFQSQGMLIHAARELRLSGYTQLDAFTPFPIHELDDALGVKPTRLPWLVLGAGLTGGIAALAFQWWTNAVDYPMLISGKPLFSLPANIPVTFEVIILAAALTAFFGMLAINGLPKLANPLFRSPRFTRATTDGFFLSVDAQDEQFDADATKVVLERAGATFVEQITAEPNPQSMPRTILMTTAVLGSLALLPPVFIASARSTTSDKPRLHNFFNMDFQPKFKSQTTTKLFDDGRAMRPRVGGTIPRGSLALSPELELGYEPTSPESDSSETLPNDRNWVADVPMPLTTQFMERGRQRFDIHCAVCHGKAGYGNGLASQRALELEQGTWVLPTSLHSPHVIAQPAGQLFNSITNGVRKMPAYGHQIPVEDRWAIVLYMQALQRSQQASLEDVPETIKTKLREMN
ncbi:MAG: DUF3341 domain-containing protein [Pirellulales bacterium]|nr:DUF3341 domain-containing protein [Pirellulales bacterium]